MSEAMPIWATFLLAGVMPLIAVIGFWMNISSRLTQAQVDAEDASERAKEANEKATLLSASFGLYREHVAANYIHRDVMREVEDRLMQAIDRLGDRLDRVLERADRKP